MFAFYFILHYVSTEFCSSTNERRSSEMAAPYAATRLPTAAPYTAESIDSCASDQTRRLFYLLASRASAFKASFIGYYESIL